MNHIANEFAELYRHAEKAMLIGNKRYSFHRPSEELPETSLWLECLPDCNTVRLRDCDYADVAPGWLLKRRGETLEVLEVEGRHLVVKKLEN